MFNYSVLNLVGSWRQFLGVCTLLATSNCDVPLHVTSDTRNNSPAGPAIDMPFSHDEQSSCTEDNRQRRSRKVAFYLRCFLKRNVSQ